MFVANKHLREDIQPPKVIFVSYSCRHVLAKFLKFRAYEYGMPRALEINSESRLKEKHVKSFSSTTKNIYPLQQCLWPPNMAG